MVWVNLKEDMAGVGPLSYRWRLNVLIGPRSRVYAYIMGSWNRADV